MADVYQYASLTFAVLGERDGDTGFSERHHEQPWLSLPCEEYQGDGSTVVAEGLLLFGQTSFPLSEDSSSADIGQDIMSSAWNERGWTLQERMLSRRILYFGREQLFWECHECTKSEDGYEDADRSASGEQTSESADALYWAAEMQNGAISAVAQRFLTNFSEGMYSNDEGTRSWSDRSWRALGWLMKMEANATWAWKSVDFLEKMTRKRLNIDGSAGFLQANILVSLYTRRQLSKSKDKLIAFEGLAKLYAARTNQDFVAGIFTQRLAKSLFWIDRTGTMTTPLPLQAPSWSWASRDGPVELDAEAMISDVSAYNGSLANITLLETNAIMRNDNERACQPVSLQTKAVHIAVLRSSAPCSSFPRAMQQLRDDVMLWSHESNAWPYERCYLMYVASPSRGSKSKHASYSCPTCRDNLEVYSDGYVNRHVELCNASAPSAYNLPREERLVTLIGVAVFDDPADAPAEFEAVLLWHRGRRNNAATRVKRARDWMGRDHTGEPMFSAREPKVQPWPRNLDKEFNFAGPASERESKVFLAHRRQYFFLLIVPGPGEGTYKRVGLGIGYWIPQADRFGGIEVTKVAKQKHVTML